jgi:hypothetical protein
VCTLRADGVQERQEYALLHELVDLGDSLIQGRWMRRHVGLRQGQKVVTNLSRQIDLTRSRLPDVGVY